eukprot:s2532_g23.t1
MRGRIDPEQKMRWLNDHRTFASWQYSEEAMLHASDGSLSVPDATVKEQFHLLPKGYTSAPGVTERARHRMIANGWHIGTAKFMMMLVLQMAATIQAGEVPSQPRHSAFQQMLQILQHQEPSIGPGSWARSPVCVPTATSMWEHWELATSAKHPMNTPRRLEPGFQQCIQTQQMIGGSLPRMRTEIIDEIASLAEDFSSPTMDWWKALPPHIRQVYYDQDHQQVSQIPLLLHLLKLTGMPSLEDLQADLTGGFQVLGTLNPGAGWLPRADQKYEYPIKTDAFRSQNRHYTMAKLRTNRVDPEWNTMLQELVKELERGRMSGPYEAPGWWPVDSISIEGKDKIPLPSQEICVSFCFSVKQTDKVRRCEDFRRSGHNSTVVAHDVPHHHDIKAFTDLALTCLDNFLTAKVWAQDLNGAYRQFPVKDPDECFCVLLTPGGPLLLRHHALMFGAASSVWNFNRAADALTFLGRRLLALSLGHYVDDFISIGMSDIVESGFEEFTRLMRMLGLRMKESKALPPDSQQKVLGVHMEIQPEAVVLSPHPNRCAKMIQALQRALDTNSLSPEEAQRLAGKMVFMGSTLFGQLGRAAMQPMYARAHGIGDTKGTSQLNGPLRSAMRAICGLLRDIQPRVIPRTMSSPVIVVYTDAYFVMNGQDFSPGSHQIPSQWKRADCPHFENGWGYVIHFEGRTFFAYGRVPAWLIQRFCSRKAYIYFLEILAQLIAFLDCRRFNSNL